jgi:3-oxoacyl-[acyl-carrier-protein] synthase III
VSSVCQSASELALLGLATSIPEKRLSLAQVFEAEQSRVDAQLAALSEPFRARLTGQLGISSIAHMAQTPSIEFAHRAAEKALERAGLDASSLGLIVDFSTFAADCPRVWSLAHHLQGKLGASKAIALGMRGSGCAGLHFALLVAEAMLKAHPSLQYALLVAADRAPDAGRSCLPVSIMSDAASALVVGRAAQNPKRLGRIHSIVTEQQGKFAEMLVVNNHPFSMHIDAAAFERKVLPLHFVMLHRLLARALKTAHIDLAAITAYVYPNTTLLDRRSIARGMNVPESFLVGPGPTNLGHAFASDLVINTEAWLAQKHDTAQSFSAWLAAGSGFSWGAAVVELEH